MSMELNKESVEQAGGDERAAFEVWFAGAGYADNWNKSSGRDLPQHEAVAHSLKTYGPKDTYFGCCTQHLWEGWQARAALAHRAPEVCSECSDTGKVYDESGDGPWSCYACTGNPEVIGYANGDELDNMLDDRTAVLSPGKTSFHTVPVYRLIRAALAQPSPVPEPFELRLCEQHHTVLQPDRTYLFTVDPNCATCLAMAAGERQPAEQAEQRLADWDEMRKERDDALARVAEMERQEPVATVAKVPGEDWNSLDFHRDLQHMQPGTKLYAAPVAQAQHSVPEGWMLVPVEPLLNMMSDKDHDTRIAAERQLLSILADAPGNLVPQAWLDVQAERRRQITAEGWTPEHDDLYCAAELPRAAAAYILNGANDEAPAVWPFVAKWWKPRDARSNYVRAGALILAEIERLDRARQGGRS
ncbi:TPA: hypothetical protein ACKPZN_003842 [Pseudomonas aeruginosa]